MSLGIDDAPEVDDEQSLEQLITTRSGIGDRIFSSLSIGSGISILVLLAGVAGFLAIEAWPYLSDTSNPQFEHGFSEFIAPIVFGTVYSSSLALLIAVVPAVGVALFISHYAPRRLARFLGALIDLLAAIPSVVYGLWGFFVIAPIMTRTFYPWSEKWLGDIPIIGVPFAGPASVIGRTMFTAAIVLAIMILPVITAISREVFLQTPRLHEEAALALGATRWEMIRMAVLPYSRSAVISGAMLGLGRALGETMALAIVLSPTEGLISFNAISDQNSQGIAPYIALNFPEARGLRPNQLVAAGLVLFAITLVVNTLARMVTDRSKKFSGAN